MIREVLATGQTREQDYLQQVVMEAQQIQMVFTQASGTKVA